MRLKFATRDLHARAEHSGVMAELLKGRIGRQAYVALLANLHAIYAALEPMLGPLGSADAFGSLARTAALESDLRAFDAEPVTRLQPATLDYVERLRGLGTATRGHRLWAHVYVRYLGDLHGGQILHRLVRERFASIGGTRFYDFGGDAEVGRLRHWLRGRLASTGLDDRQGDDVVAEAVWAFEAHCRLFEQIQASQA